MEKPFGVPMDTIMFVLVGLFAIAMASVLLIFLSNRVMFRMGVRNLPRRGLQTGLVGRHAGEDDVDVAGPEGRLPVRRLPRPHPL